MINKVFTMSYYEDIWLDIDLLPVEKLDIMAIINPITDKADLSRSKVWITFKDKKLKKVNVGHRIVHALKFYAMLPYLLLNYRHFFFIAPPYFHFLAQPIMKLFGKKVYTMAGDPYSEIAKEPLWQASASRKLLRKLLYPIYVFSEYAAIRMSDKVFAVTPYLFKKYKTWAKDLESARNGGPVEEISRIKTVKVTKEDYIYYVGGIMKWRGIDMLVDAFKKVKERYRKPLKLVIVGGDREEFDAYPEIKDLGKVEKDVVFTGRKPFEVALGYSKGAKIAVMPNRDTPMSRMISSAKVFEYISAEVPQVCTDTGDHADVVRDLDVGIVVKDNPHSIADGILKLLNDKKLYDRFKKNCIKRKWEIDYKVMRAPIRNFFLSLVSRF